MVSFLRANSGLSNQCKFISLCHSKTNIQARASIHLAPVSFRCTTVGLRVKLYVPGLNNCVCSSLFKITKQAKSETKMQIIGTPRESNNIIVLWKKREENESQICVLKIVLGTLAYAHKKPSNRPPFCFVWVCLSELWLHSRASLNWER